MTTYAPDKSFSVDYDADSDVLYVTKAHGVPDTCQEIDDGVLFRRSIRTKQPTGFTILWYKQANRSANAQLLSIISRKLGLDKDTLKRALTSAYVSG